MKKIVQLLCMLLVTTSVYALDINNNSASTSESAAGAGAKAEAYSNGANGSYNTNVEAAGLGDAVGAAYAPALTTTLTETCMGSTSVGAGFSGGSFSFGTTWRDSACVRRLDARQIQSMGDVQAAKEIMCDSDLVRNAFKRVGRPCAEDGGVYTPIVKAEVPAPVAAPAPAAATQKVDDEQDLADAQNKAILNKADAARQAIKDKYNF